ncbi:acetyl-CoA acetyltransferase [Rhodococcoides trifolii]|uniref:Acetyl-CoA acetyltransferase n=1 Tax=Rhodococcoides trifolii TaxID=908250 RepID=A0A917CW38_9NOCA|nr:acetyl-CoA acetyltransferase [Rhodococcus trifolii]GGG00280.1 acetyl-CoA acetyltransferase [Rhodococcus trifolii]
MADPRRVPVVVGVGEVRGDPTTPREPIELILEAASHAEIDSQARLLADADSVSASNVASWAYHDVAAALATRLGASPAHTFSAPIGGQWPAQLLDAAAARIASGESTVAVIAGGEAQASVSAMQKAGRDPVVDGGWSRDPGGPPHFDLDQLGSAAMQHAGTVVPVRIYPLFENRLRFDLGQSVEEADAWSSAMYSAFSSAAASNPIAWQREARSAQDIATVGPKNRMVCEPYPLSMNAMPHVDQAAVVIVTSLDAARSAGVPENKIVYVWGGAGVTDTQDILQRSTFGMSDALTSALDRALTAASVDGTTLDIVDVYSCFPIVPKMAALHLGMPRSAVLSVTGGHSSFGGPLNSYSLHSVAAVTKALRSGAKTALVHANGGYMTYQHSVLLGSSPHPDGYIGTPEPVVLEPSGPVVVAETAGRVVVETATVEHAKDGSLGQAFLVARDADDNRVAVQTAAGDVDSARVLSLYRDDGAREVVGTTVEIEPYGEFVRIRPV